MKTNRTADHLQGLRFWMVYAFVSFACTMGVVCHVTHGMPLVEFQAVFPSLFASIFVPLLLFVGLNHRRAEALLSWIEKSVYKVITRWAMIDRD